MSADRPDPRTVRSVVLALTLLMVMLGGCTAPDGTDDEDQTDQADADGTDSGTTDEAAAGLRLSFSDHPDLGPILVDGDGMTLYVFTDDTPGESVCYDQCADAWPPVEADETPDGPDAIADRLGTTSRDDGTGQATYRDRPLYYFVQDEAAGDANGDGINGVWFVVREPPEDPATLDGRGDHEVTTETVNYHDDSEGHYAAPAEGDATTGIVMIHEWWGLNDNIRNMSELLASHGHAVLAVDLFDGDVAEDAEAARQQVDALDQEAAVANMQSAAEHLRSEGAEQIVSLGWCFGGGQSLQLAMSGETLAGTIIYYGEPTSDEARLDAIDWPVLGIFGEDDQVISVSDVRAFEGGLDNLSIPNDIYIYPDVGHAFANPSGDGWAAEESQDAWARTLRWLDENA